MSTKSMMMTTWANRYAGQGIGQEGCGEMTELEKLKLLQKSIWHLEQIIETLFRDNNFNWMSEETEEMFKNIVEMSLKLNDIIEAKEKAGAATPTNSKKIFHMEKL